MLEVLSHLVSEADLEIPFQERYERRSCNVRQLPTLVFVSRVTSLCWAWCRSLEPPRAAGVAARCSGAPAPFPRCGAAVRWLERSGHGTLQRLVHGVRSGSRGAAGRSSCRERATRQPRLSLLRTARAAAPRRAAGKPVNGVPARTAQLLLFLRICVLLV